MFEFLKKRQLAKVARDIQDQFKGAERDIGAKWAHFVATVHFKSGVPLSEKIDAFAEPILHFVRAKYPLVVIGPSGAEAYWLLIFVAVRESKTHSLDEVNTAMAELKSKYARAS